MIDTGVFIAAFSRSENADLRDRARDLLENPTRYSVRQWLVPAVVIVESWGMFTKSEHRRDTEGALRMLTWINHVGNPVVVLRSASQPSDIESIVRAHRVDVVDAVLIDLIEKIAAQCRMRSLRLATLDISDFSRLRGQRTAPLRLFDVRHLQDEEDD